MTSVGLLGPVSVEDCTVWGREGEPFGGCTGNCIKTKKATLLYGELSFVTDTISGSSQGRIRSVSASQITKLLKKLGFWAFQSFEDLGSRASGGLGLWCWDPLFAGIYFGEGVTVLKNP